MTAPTPNIQQAGKFVCMQPNPTVDTHLSPKTLNYLQQVGLPNSEELNLDFTGQMVLASESIIRFMEMPIFKSADSVPEMSSICLDLQQNELIRWIDEPELGFINSSAEQFAQSVLAFEYYIEHIQAKEIFGPFYDNDAVKRNRPAYAKALTDRLREIDPVIFERGYYWPSFIEEIENGL